MKKQSNSRLKLRHLKEILFQIIAKSAIVLSFIILACLLFSIVERGYYSFYTHKITLEFNIENNKNNTFLEYDNMLHESFFNLLKSFNIETKNLNPYDIISSTEKYYLEKQGNNNIKIQNRSVLLNSSVDVYLKHPKSQQNIISKQVRIIVDELVKNNLIKTKFNWEFFTNSDSRFTETAGIKGAFVGSLYTILLTMAFSIIVSVGAAIYLEEFTKKGKLYNFIEININNLAAVPSIIFGLLGFMIFQQILHVPRATPLLAALVLTLMSLPTIIMSARLAIQNSSKALKEAVYGIGASRLQYIIHHLLPNTFSGIITGIIISMSRAIGETAPLLMIGMIAFVSDTPSSITDKSTAFPVQILLWSTAPEAGFLEKASGAIIVLLILLIALNSIAIYLRNKVKK